VTKWVTEAEDAEIIGGVAAELPHQRKILDSVVEYKHRQPGELGTQHLHKRG